ncbi:MAG: hypothetical protein HYX91_03475 [Chloroflexi bacterium]|nr:hypothetical protein [Chloroflexota bacterium]
MFGAEAPVGRVEAGVVAVPVALPGRVAEAPGAVPADSAVQGQERAARKRPW